ncbi:MAG: hypothetical protein N5P05_001856 [Chroococcopsis gigantea SAG 12.99]|jgi:hypothetical protein|nr:heterocyst frequency control protein PatD [Chlorogloea purpurea SAG 13.99]MDV3000250.1 hypothetical protein [Chroococcopsis gigantea SAG 12.99]
MLPTSYHQVYQDFYLSLSRFSAALSAADFALEKADFEEIRSIFQSGILPLTGEDLSTVEANRWRPVQTELYRAWRLLETDWLFLTAAKGGAMKQQRRSGVKERLEQLSRYCEFLLQSENDHE